SPTLRPDGNDLIFGGAAADVARDALGDTAADGHAQDSDAIAGDNANVFRLVSGGAYLAFAYDDYSTARIVPRAVQLPDYTPGNHHEAMINVIGELRYTADLVPDNLDPSGAPASTAMTQPLFANDVIFGGWGSDAIHGGAGSDALSGAEVPVLAYANQYDANG